MENALKDPWDKAGDQQVDKCNLTMRYRILQGEKENCATDFLPNPTQGSGNRPRYRISLRTRSKPPLDRPNDWTGDSGSGVALFTNAMIKNKIAEGAVHNPPHELELAPCIREEDGEASPEKPRLHAVY